MSNHDQEKPAVFADTRELLFETALSGNVFKDVLVDYLSDLTKGLKGKGCTIIGHIKGKIDTTKNGQLFFNLTTFDGEPRIHGKLEEQVEAAELTINIIVYGVTEEQVKEIFEMALSTERRWGSF